MPIGSGRFFRNGVLFRGGGRGFKGGATESGAVAGRDVPFRACPPGPGLRLRLWLWLWLWLWL